MLMRLTSAMLIRHTDGGKWHTPRTTAYTNEAELRDLLAETPSLLPGIDAEATAVARELPTGTGPADVVIVDGTGEITVVECKLRANPEIRRQVVGQLLAYASAISEMRFEGLDDAFRRSKADESLLDALAHDNDLDEEDFRRAVNDNLHNGRMRLIIAVDKITDELKRTVSYLNRHTTKDVGFLAFEIRREEDEGVEILLPEIYGEESVREKKRGSGGPLLDRETLLAGIRERSESAAHTVASVLDWAENETRLTVRYTGRAGVRFLVRDEPLLLINRRGQLVVFLRSLPERAEGWDEQSSKQLLGDLADLGIRLDAKRPRPRALIDPLADEAALTRFFGLVEGALDRLTGHP